MRSHRKSKTKFVNTIAFTMLAPIRDYKKEKRKRVPEANLSRADRTV